MSDKLHDIVAECPKCGKRDLVQADDGQWICLNCKFSEKTPQPRGSDSDIGFGGMLVAVWIVALVMFALVAM